MGAIGQFRVMGGSISLSICTNVLNHHLSSTLNSISGITSTQISALLNTAQSITLIPPAMQAMVKNVYAQGYGVQIQATTAFSAAAFFATLLLVERSPRWQKSEEELEEEK